MHVTTWKSGIAATGSIFAIAVLLAATAAPPRSQSTEAAPGETVLVMDPDHSKVHFTVDSTLHTVHGTFNLKNGALHFDPHSGKAGGEITVSATSGDSGNDSRDKRMHKEILETPKFPDVVFRPTQVEGVVALAGASDVKLHGVMLLHGTQHELVVPVHADLSGDRWKGTANFDVPYVDWGIKDPSNWLLKVKHVVHVELDAVGSTKTANQR
jgi:polyisoprenoid-binding protein YceI